MSRPGGPDRTALKVFWLMMIVVFVLAISALYYKDQAKRPCDQRPASAATR